MEQSISRRALLSAGVAMCVAGPLAAVAARAAGPAGPRVIIDNDFNGDPDGLFQLAHFVLSRSVAIPLVVGSQYKDFGEADRIPDKAHASMRKARELLAFFPAKDRPLVVPGSDVPMASRSGSTPSDASAAIIREALRDDASGPLFYAAGGSLTEIALAWLAEPRIGKRLRLLWIGGAEHPDLASPPPGPGEAEYNFSLDRIAAQVVFNESDIEIWQVPRNAFRQMLIGMAELEDVARTGALGRYLQRQVVDTERRLAANLPPFIFRAGETYALGDTALVTLAALQSGFQPDTSSSRFVTRPTPRLNEDGSYTAAPAGRPMRIYESIDSHLTWRDFLAKLRYR